MFVLLSLPRENSIRLWNNCQSVAHLHDDRSEDRPKHGEVHREIVEECSYPRSERLEQPVKIQRLLCKLYELCEVLPVTVAFHLQQHVRQRTQLVVRPNQALGSLVSSRDPSVLIARRLDPLPESEETLSEHQRLAVVSLRTASANSCNDAARRRQDWYLRKCYARELQIIQSRSPTTNMDTMADSTCERTAVLLTE